MKKPKDSTDLAALLQTAATTPALTVAAPEQAPQKPTKTKKGASMAVYLRLPADIHSRLEAEAVARTKKTGRGVTVQQIIIERLGV